MSLNPFPQLMAREILLLATLTFYAIPAYGLIPTQAVEVIEPCPPCPPCPDADPCTALLDLLRKVSGPKPATKSTRPRRRRRPKRRRRRRRRGDRKRDHEIICIEVEAPQACWRYPREIPFTLKEDKWVWEEPGKGNKLTLSVAEGSHQSKAGKTSLSHWSICDESTKPLCDGSLFHKSNELCIMEIKDEGCKRYIPPQGQWHTPKGEIVEIHCYDFGSPRRRKRRRSSKAHRRRPRKNRQGSLRRAQKRASTPCERRCESYGIEALIETIMGLLTMCSFQQTRCCPRACSCSCCKYQPRRSFPSVCGEITMEISPIRSKPRRSRRSSGRLMERLNPT